MILRNRWAVIWFVFIILFVSGCSMAQVKTSDYQWINTWGVEYYRAEGGVLQEDARHFDAHMSPHNLRGLKNISGKSMALLYVLWREHYASREAGAEKDRRKMRSWAASHGSSIENFYLHYGRDVTIKGRNPESGSDELVVIPGWDPRNDRNGDGKRDLPSDFGTLSSTGTGFLEDRTKNWSRDCWLNSVLVDKTGTKYKITGNSSTKLYISSGRPASGRYGISSGMSEDHFATARTKDQSRVKTFIWENYAYALNLGNTQYRNFRIYDTKKLTVEGDKSWDEDADSLWDGVMLDNTSPDFPWPEIADGVEVITEYPNKTKWRDDQVRLIREVKKAIGKKLVIPNTGSYDYVEAADAGGGQHQEQYVAFTNEHGPVQWDYWIKQNEKGKYCLVLPSYGSWEADPERERMHYLGFHYMGQQPYIYLGFRGFGYREILKWKKSAEDWLPAAQVDVGRALDRKYALAASGKDPVGQDYRIYTRKYSKALIVCRPKFEWSQDKYDDKTAVTFKLPPHDTASGRSSLYRALNADGTLGKAVSEVKPRNPESFILFPAE